MVGTTGATPGIASILPKTPTGIQGLDEVTGGGLPAGRPTLVCGSAGSGKTLLATEFLVHGAMLYDEPGVFMSFEETGEDLARNVASLGFDLPTLIEQGRLEVDFVRVERSEIEETGEYDLEGLFIRLGLAIDSIGARRVVLDTIEALFGGLDNAGILRAELRRLFHWLKDRGVTTVITGERGERGALTRHGLEEYVSDCVILLDHRVQEQQSTRRMRIVKYRGSTHGTNEYPFLITEDGITMLPITSVGLDHTVSDARVSSGVPGLDDMLEGQGYYRGSSILLSGTAGTGKSSLAAHFAEATCRAGERCLYFAFEESADQIMRNMGSIGIALAPWKERGLLRFHSSRPTFSGLESHLVLMHKMVREFQPAAVIVDPITNLLSIGEETEVHAMLMRLIDLLKSTQVTALFTSLTSPASSLERTEAGISSLMDTWLLLRDIEVSGERNRGLYVLKSRGMAHSNQIREFLLTSEGVQLVDAYLGPGGVLTGSARLAQEARERATAEERRRALARERGDQARRRKALEAQLASVQAELEATDRETARIDEDEQLLEQHAAAVRRAMAQSRQAADPPAAPNSHNGRDKEASNA